MPSMFLRGEAMIDRMFETSGTSVSYRRDGEVMVESAPAKVGRTLFRTDDVATGVVFRFEERDFIVRASDFAAIGEPRRGDEIVWDGRLYLVAAPDGEPCWKWHTRQSHTQMRIHAKYSGAPEEELK